MNRTQNELQLYLLFNLPYILRCLPYNIPELNLCVYNFIFVHKWDDDDDGAEE